MKKTLGVILVLGFLGGCGQTNKVAKSTSLQGTPPGSQTSQVVLNWTSNKGEQQGFDIEESTDEVTFTQIQSVVDGVNTATVSVNPSQKYFFRIRSFNQAGFSPYTKVVVKGS